MDDPEIQNQIRPAGVRQNDDSLDPLAEVLGTGADWACGVGYALALGAVDWRRCGISRPVPATLLRALAESHLGARGRAGLADQRTYETGLAWATGQTNPRRPALRPAGPDAFSVDDYAVDLISARGAAIPLHSWQVAIENASAAELLHIGHMAAAHGQLEIAARAYRTAEDRGDADEAEDARMYLEGRLSPQGDIAEPKAAYRQAIRASASAALNRGDLLKEQGDIAGAKSAYQQAIDSRDDLIAPEAALRLGDLLKEHGEIAGAKAAYLEAIDSGDRVSAPTAAFQLGDLLWEQGEIAGAKSAYQEAIGTGQRHATARAAFQLGEMLKSQGDIVRAKSAYQQAIDSQFDIWAPMAAFVLGKMLEEQGDIAGAKAAYQQAICCGHPRVTPDAAARLAALSGEQGAGR